MNLTFRHGLFKGFGLGSVVGGVPFGVLFLFTSKPWYQTGTMFLAAFVGLLLYLDERAFERRVKQYLERRND